MWKDKEEIINLIKDFDEYIELDSDDWRVMLHDFITWLYEEKKYRVVNTRQQPHDVDKYYEE